MARPLTIVSVAAEVAPYAKAGGVATVVRSLSKTLGRMGHAVTVITPLHGSIERERYKLERIAVNIPVTIDSTATRNADFWRVDMDGIPVYFVDNIKYFSSHKHIYGTQYQNTRYLFFNLAVFKLLNFLKVCPDILQCNDWQMGLVPHFLNKRFRKNPLFAKTRTVYTIHNLTHQFGRDWWTVPLKDKDDGRRPLPKFTDKHRIEHINFAKRAILEADILNTVSETYREEILTRDLGQDLHRILQNRKDRLFGIINGIDYNDYNPATDPGLYRNYDVNSLHLKQKNKRHLQRQFNLPEADRVPLIGMATRITEQKGFDLLIDGLEPLMRLDVQFTILGAGQKTYEQFLRKTSKRYPKKFACHLQFEPTRATQIHAGSDMFLMPSRFEPSGLPQMESLRYGSIPIVRAVGGLNDTITDYNPRTEQGNGFVFKKYDNRDMLIAIARALETYKDRERWDRLMRAGMQQSFSWEIPAKKYVTIFRKALV